MNEEEFDSLRSWRPFRNEDLARTEAEAGRCTMLGLALWGRTSADLQRQLSFPYPEIPSGCELADLRKLQRIALGMATAGTTPQKAWLSPLSLPSQIIFLGTHRLTVWEARGEIVRRAIEYLEKR